MITKEWNLEEYQSCNDGDPPQECESKGIGIWPTHIGLCTMNLVPLLMLIDSS